jgi:hypothetical protein
MVQRYRYDANGAILEAAHGMNFSAEGYDGTQFRDLHVRRDASVGPGWFIFGRDKAKYGVFSDGPNKGKGRYVMLCGYVRRGRARNYNGEVRIGWPRKRDAEAALAAHVASYPHLRGK